MKTIISAVVALLLATQAAAVSINCDGPPLLCGVNEFGRFPTGHTNLHDLILTAEKSVNDTRVYKDTERPVCMRPNSWSASGICAIVYDGNIEGKRVKELLKDIENHGCKRCGNAPAGDTAKQTIFDNVRLSVKVVKDLDKPGMWDHEHWDHEPWL